MSLPLVIGIGLANIGLLRLADIAWPTEFLPWWFYAIECAIGFYLVIQFQT